MGRAQAASIFVQAMPGTGGPKSWPMAMFQWWVRQLSIPGLVAITARCIVSNSEDGVIPVACSCPVIAVNQQMFREQCTLILSLEVVYLDCSLSVVFSCIIMAEHQWEVSWQARVATVAEGCDEAAVAVLVLPLCWPLAAEVAARKLQSLYRAGLKFCDLTYYFCAIQHFSY